MPTFFDHLETKRHLWRERSIERILDLQRNADLLVHSIGAFESGVPSHVYTGGYLSAADLEELQAEGVVGDIATVFYRADGSWRDIPINARASRPSLQLFADARDAICVVAGEAKARGLLGALRGGYVKRLVTDAATARRVLELAGAESG